jgi:hypothetical protein
MNFIDTRTRMKIEEFLKAGMQIIVLEELPRYTLRDGKVTETDWNDFRQMDGFHVAQTADESISVLTQKGLQDVVLHEPDRDIIIAHRTRPEMDIYLIVNGADELKEFDAIFSATGEPTLWDPLTGQIERVAPERIQRTQDQTRIRLKLPSYRSLFVVFHGGES